MKPGPILFLITAAFSAYLLTSPRHQPPPTPSSQTQTLSSPPPSPAPALSHTPYGLPQSSDVTNTFQHIGYTVGYSTRRNNPIWVAYQIPNIPPGAAKSEKRPDSFYPNPALHPAHQIQTNEFTNTGYDRGHMAPNWAISIGYGRQAQIETFFLTNICPQRPECNRHLWETLEKIEANDYARRYNGVTTFTGPVFSTHPAGIGANHRIQIPDAFYKIILREQNQKTDALAFIIPQNPNGDTRDSLNQYLTTIELIENQTGVYFLTAIEPNTAKNIKTFKPQRIW